VITSVPSFEINGDIVPASSILKVRTSLMGGETDYLVHLVNSSVYYLNTGNPKELPVINSIRAYLGLQPYVPWIKPTK